MHKKSYQLIGSLGLAAVVSFSSSGADTALSQLQKASAVRAPAQMRPAKQVHFEEYFTVLRYAFDVANERIQNGDNIVRTEPQYNELSNRDYQRIYESYSSITNPDPSLFRINTSEFIFKHQVGELHYKDANGNFRPIFNGESIYKRLNEILSPPNGVNRPKLYRMKQGGMTGQSRLETLIEMAKRVILVNDADLDLQRDLRKAFSSPESLAKFLVSSSYRDRTGVLRSEIKETRQALVEMLGVYFHGGKLSSDFQAEVLSKAQYYKPGGSCKNIFL